MILLDIIPVDKDNQEIYPYSEINIDSVRKQFFPGDVDERMQLIPPCSNIWYNATEQDGVAVVSRERGRSNFTQEGYIFGIMSFNSAWLLFGWVFHHTLAAL